jgi:hypothetical protein
MSKIDVNNFSIKELIDFIAIELRKLKSNEEIDQRGDPTLFVGWRVYAKFYDLMEHTPVETFRGIRIELSYRLDVDEMELELCS